MRSAPAEEIRGTLAVPVADDAAMTEAVARLAAAGVGVIELALHLPSLDEVFQPSGRNPIRIGAFC